MNYESSIRVLSIAGLTLLIGGVISNCLHAKEKKQLARVSFSKVPKKNRVLKIPAGDTFSEVEVFDMRMDVRFPSERKIKAQIIALYVPDNGLFWWRYQRDNLGSKRDRVESFFKAWQIRIFDEKIFGFRLFSAPPRILIRESANRHTSIESARAALVSSIEEHILDEGGGVLNSSFFWGHNVELRKFLDYDFLYLKDSATTFPGPTIRDISSNNSGLTIGLDGPNGDHANIVLNNAYEVLSVTINGKAVFPAKEPAEKK